MPRWLRRLVNRVRYRRFDRDLREELAAHEEMARAGLEGSGGNSIEARTHARRVMGNVALAREDGRAVWIPATLESVISDVRYAARTLVARPGYTATAILTLAVAMGLNTSLFTVLSTVYLQGWPVPESGRVFMLSTEVPRADGPGAVPGEDLSYATFSALAAAGTRAELAAYVQLGLRLSTDGGSTFLATNADAVTNRFFETLRVPLESGRGFGDRAAGASVVIISDRLWRLTFGGDRSVVGRVVQLDGMPTTIVGIVAPDFMGIPPRPTDLYVPFPDETHWAETWRRWWGDVKSDPRELTVHAVGRLRPGASRPGAAVELTSLWSRQPADSSPQPGAIVLSGTALGQQPGGVRDGVGVILTLLVGATILVLLLGCGNVGNLQFARGLARGRELGTRAALGASRGRLVRQLLTESFVLAIAGGAAAMLVAGWLPATVLALAEQSPTTMRFTPGMDVYGAAFLLALLATLASGLVPALHCTRAGFDGLSDGVRTTGASAGRIRGSLLALQVAVSTVLLMSASLLTRGLVRATTTDIGFDYRGISGAMMPLPRGADRATQIAVFRASVRPALAAAGFDRATMAAIPPLSSGSRTTAVQLLNGASTRSFVDACASDYFAMLGIPIKAGRTLSDDVGAHEAVVNEAYVRDVLGGAPAVGTTVVVDKLRWTIVGVARDAHLHTLDRSRPDVFLPLAEENGLVSVLVRDPRPDAGTRLMAVLKALQPDGRPAAFSLNGNILSTARNSIFTVSIVSGIGLLALALATLGVFGVFGYLVEERRREIGIRLALGARRGQVVALVLGSARGATIGGLAVGLGLAAAASGLLRSYLYGLSPLDPLSYLTVAAILAAAATIATAVPARRATRIDPARTLRAE